MVLRIVCSVIGVLMILIGTVWILQGQNIAFRRGFMVGDYHWTIYGAVVALAGAALVIVINTRGRGA